MQEDMIWDAVAGGYITEEQAEQFRRSGNKLTPEIRQALKEDGWEFGPHIFSIHRCPGCDSQEPTDKSRASMIDEIAYLLGDDTDGFISLSEDFGLWE
jgi:hypothetical protein